MDEWLRRIINQADGFKESMVLLTASELDLFSVLGADRLSAEDIAGRLNTDPRATWLWLNALVALGVLEKKGRRYANTVPARKFLDHASPEYRGALLRHIARYWRQWAGLTEVLKTGAALPRSDDGGTAADFAWAMHHGSLEHAPEVAALLWPEPAASPRAEGPERTALDLGGGPGTYAVAMARRNPQLRLTVFDRPAILEVTRQVVEGEGLAGRVGLKPGDFCEDDLGAGYDLILASSVIHSYGEADVSAIIRKCARALAPGGRLAVHDFLLDETLTRPAQAALFGVHMLVVGAAGRSYSVGEVSEWMREAGLDELQHLPIGDGSSSLLIGHRKRTRRAKGDPAHRASDVKSPREQPGR